MEHKARVPTQGVVGRPCQEVMARQTGATLTIDMPMHQLAVVSSPHMKTQLKLQNTRIMVRVPTTAATMMALAILRVRRIAMEDTYILRTAHNKRVQTVYPRLARSHRHRPQQPKVIKVVPGLNRTKLETYVT